MKKLFAILMAVSMLLTLAVAAYAADPTGSITVNGITANSDSVYDVYKLLKLNTYNITTGKYSYSVEADWAGFFAAEGAPYIELDESGYVVKWTAADDDDTVAEFAKLALAYAKANDIDPVKSSSVSGDMVVTTNPETGKVSGKFSDLPLGYYLVDSNLGALCGLTTTNPDASINAKNSTPTIDKQVKEDSTNQWADANTADIGQTVEFRVTINVHAGAENYVLHDVMSAGLTFGQVSKIERVIPGATEAETVTETLTYTDDYTVSVDKARDMDDVTPDYYGALTGEDDCTLEVVFTKDFCDSLDTNNKVIVYYEAMLNRNALVAGDGNTNKAELEFGEDHYTTEDVTTTKTYGFDIVKTDSQNTLLDGAVFKIYDAATGGNEVAVVLMDDGVTYRRARANEPGVEIKVNNGQVRVVGFDNGTYYLEETVAPTGYNKLTARQRFIISDANLDKVFNDGIFSTGSGVHVINKTGSILPETGGLGTTLFCVIGGMVMLACGVVLFTRKRMAQIAE